MDRQIKFQMREEPSVYSIIDIISAVANKLSEYELSKDECRVLLRCSSWISKFLKLEQSRKIEVDNLTHAALASKKLSIWFLLKKIEMLDKKIAKLEDCIMLVESDPTMQRIFNIGKMCLRKNPKLAKQHMRESARYSLDHQIGVISNLLRR